VVNGDRLGACKWDRPGTLEARHCVTEVDGDGHPLVEPLEASWINTQSHDPATNGTVREHSSPRFTSNKLHPSDRIQHWSTSFIWVTGILGFGLPSVILRPSFVTIARCVLLAFAIPAAFLCFGPYWAEELFSDTSYSDLGVYPFIATCICIPFLSVWLGFRDRSWLQARHSEQSSNPPRSL